MGSSYVSSTDSNKTSHIDSPIPMQSQTNGNSLEATNNYLNSNYHSTNGTMTTLPRYQNSYNTLISELNDMNEHLNNRNESNGHDCINNDDKTDSVGSLSPVNGEYDGKSESIYGSIRPINNNNNNSNNNGDEFTYKTINGGIIRSVHPPGKGNSANYKVRALISLCQCKRCLFV